MNNNVIISGREIGAGNPPFIIAEIGMNHNGDIDLARRQIKAASDSGADAVKFQSFKTNRYLAPNSKDFSERQKHELTPEEHHIIKEFAEDLGLVFFSTPFDRESVDLLDDLDVPCFKVASLDVTNHPLLRYIAKKGRPIILSTGYASHSEVAEAVELIRSISSDKLVLLHCVSIYPTPPERMNLLAIKTLRRAFQVPVGLSDHSKGSPIAPVTATALGACVIEKHFTVDNELIGYDHAMSESANAFRRMSSQIKMTQDALGNGEIEPLKQEAKKLPGVRRSLYWDGTYEIGKRIEPNMLIEMRPGEGLRPALADEIVGQYLLQDVAGGTLVHRSQIDWRNR